jgi:hypothetical protein
MYLFADAYDFAVDNVANLLFTLGGLALVSYVGANVVGWLV